MEGGTRVCVWLNEEPDQEGGLLCPEGTATRAPNLGALCAWLAPALDVDLYVNDRGRTRRVLAASDWLTIDAMALLQRVTLRRLPELPDAEDFSSRLRVIRNIEGDPVGRANDYTFPWWVLLGLVRRSYYGRRSPDGRGSLRRYPCGIS